MDLAQVQNAVTLSGYEDGYSLNGRLWTKSSSPGMLHEAVQYCATRGGRMFTLDEAIEFRTVFNNKGVDGAYNHQFTGTLAAIEQTGDIKRVHVYEPSMDVLVKLAQQAILQNGFFAFDVKRKSALGKDILDFSRKTGRHFIVAPDLAFDVQADKTGVSEYSGHAAVRALMPLQAQTNAAIIQHLKPVAPKYGGILIGGSSTVSKGMLLLMSCRLGGEGGGSFDCVYITQSGHDIGCTRAILPSP